MANEIMETLKLEIESLKNVNKQIINKNQILYRKNKNLRRATLRLKNKNYNLVKFIDNIQDNIQPCCSNLTTINEVCDESSDDSINKHSNIQLEWDYIEDINN